MAPAQLSGTKKRLSQGGGAEASRRSHKLVFSKSMTGGVTPRLRAEQLPLGAHATGFRTKQEHLEGGEQGR